MLSIDFRNLLKHLQDLPRRAGSALESLGAERRCAVRLDRLGDKLDAMGERINLLRACLSGEIGQAIDADHALRDSLKGLKEDIRDARCQLVGIQSEQLSARLQRAFTRLGKIAEETYVRADKLQWELEEHEQRFA